MTGRVAGLWRYPIKGIGREALDQVDLTAGAPMPMDRAWALLHAGAPDTDAWQPRRNFLVVANGPKLAQVTAKSDAEARISLSHPEQPNLTFDPATEGSALIDWVKPLWPERLRAPHRLVKAPAKGMADNGEPQVALLNLSSLRALGQRLGQALQIERFRGNIVLDGLGPWEEFEWIGATLEIGGATVEVTDRIERCQATEASPINGTRDAQTLRGLNEGWGHLDFGVYATVRTPGFLRIGDTARRK